MSESGHEAFVENGVAIVTDLDPSEIDHGLIENPLIPPVVKRALASWAEEVQGTGKRSRSIFERERYVTPGQVFKQMAVSLEAMDDDIVGSVADTSEAMAFQKVHFESDDKDQESVWNQIGADLDLDTWVRRAWRELYINSQFYGVREMGRVKYRVKGVKKERPSRKEFNVFVPTRLGFLDPTRIVPVQTDLYGDSGLAWIASPNESEFFTKVVEGKEIDPVLSSLLVGKYTPSKKEEQDFGKEDIPVEKLFLLNPNMVFRHTLTRSTYERWARVRMKAIFPLLDMKSQLREMDRTWLLGGINFIVLVTRGSDARPTSRGELMETQSQVRTQSKSPIIVSDHRTEISIITPEVEHVLAPEKWGVLDERIMMRLWGTFQLPSETSNRETSLTLGKVIARGLASRRHMLKRSMEAELIRPVIRDGRNIDVGFEAATHVEFAPRRMELEMDATLITLIQELRDRGDLSRETVLNEFNFDQDLEARRRQLEAERYDPIFAPVNVPFDSPNKTTPGGSGRQGGRPGGQTPDADGRET